MGEGVSVWWGQSFNLGQQKIQKMDDGVNVLSAAELNN